MMNYLKPLLTILFISLFSINSYSFEYKKSSNLSLNENSKVIGTTVPATFMLFSFEPDIIAGWNTPLYKHEKKYIPKKYHNLDVLGGWYGGGNKPNKEVLLSKKLDAAFAIGGKQLMIKEMEKYMKSINIPLVTLYTTSIEEDVKAYNILGELFNNKKRSQEINMYILKSINNTKAVTDKIKKKKKIYLALGENGLRTRCVDSVTIAGGEYVHKCSKMDETLSFEQIFSYDIDFILIGKRAAYEYMMKDKKWQQVEAIKKGNFLLVPEEPFSWVEKKTIMEYFVIQYLAAKLYPELSTIDLHSQLIEHINLFLHYPLTYKEADRLINYK